MSPSDGRPGERRGRSCRPRITRYRSSSTTSSGSPSPRSWSAGTRRASTSGHVPTSECVRIGDVARAARCAFWLAFVLLNKGELARGGGLGRPGAAAARRRRRWTVSSRATCAMPPPSASCSRATQRAARMAFAARRRSRRPLPRPRAGRAGPGRPGPVPDLPRGDRRGHGPARRGHGGGHGARGVPDRGRRPLLHGDRGVPGGLRRAPGPGVDGGAQPLVRRAARAGALPRPVPGASCRAHAAARARGRTPWTRCSGRCDRLARPTGQPRPRRRVLRAGRAPPAARRVRRGGGGVPAGQPVGTRSRSPAWRCCGSRRAGSTSAAPPSAASWTRPRTPSTRSQAAGPLRRDRARQPATSPPHAPRPTSCRRSPPRGTRPSCAPCPPTRPARSSSPRGTRAPHSARSAARGGVARAGGAVRSGARPRADRAGLPGAGGRGRRAMELDAARSVFRASRRGARPGPGRGTVAADGAPAPRAG